ncbi:conjugal transfer protein [Micrococcus luteus]|uniref:conjugal transfer protein n=1 Tax=Micrococcus luteus TaxID=1270 RepID=UPI0023025796|nr:conjugal transfer protein [Micrococcus luteus]
MKRWGKKDQDAELMDEPVQEHAAAKKKRGSKKARAGKNDPGPERTGVNSASTRLMVGGVYALIGLGAIGGVMGASAAMSPDETLAAPVEYVPTTLAEGVAVNYVTSWLQATQTDQALVKTTSGSSLPVAPMTPLQFSNVTVAGAARTDQPDVVSVTVSAVVEASEAKDSEAEDKDETASKESPRPAASEASDRAQKTAQEAKQLAQEAKDLAAGKQTGSTNLEVRYWLVSVHQSPAGQVQVVGYPTPVPAPSPPAERLVLDYSERLDPLSELGETVNGFLQSYAAGEGDTRRYLAPSSTVRGIVPAPYTEVHLMELRGEHTTEDLTPGQPLRLLVQAEAELPSSEGDKQAITIALTVQEREDRWEVTTVDPAPLITEQDAP